MSIQKLFSVPPALVSQFGGIPGHDWFAASDPAGRRLGSGGGTAHLVAQAWRRQSGGEDFLSWMKRDRRILIHAGGQSRRLPAYAACGKALVPVPVLRWARGQSVRQSLAEVQMPLLEEMMEAAPQRLRWLIVSGDVLVRAGGTIRGIPDADVVSAGLWTEPEVALAHGVFFSPRGDPQCWDFMLQKPSLETLRTRAEEHLFQLDVGLWMLSDAAMLALMTKCGWNAQMGKFEGGEAREYDLYGDFGLALGKHPSRRDEALASLSSAVYPLPEGHFHHFGRSRDLIGSALALQNAVTDLREVQMRFIKPHPDLFVQNAVTESPLDATHREIWIENAHVPSSWRLRRRHVVTGVPENRWRIDLPEGVCLDFVPVGESEWCLRPYGMDDAFRGAIGEEKTLWMGRSARDWFAARGIGDFAGITPETDLQQAPLFPVFAALPEDENLLQWMLDASLARDPDAARAQYLAAVRKSADELGNEANLARLFAQKKTFLALGAKAIAEHASRSVFYQCDLADMARIFAESGHPAPEAAPDRERQPLLHAQDRMFRSQLARLAGGDGDALKAEAFAALRSSIVGSLRADPVNPQARCLSDQIIWGRSPVRFDLAGGWTDTPPYCLFSGGKVVNIAIELNGQPPLQVFARLTDTPQIVLRSIDLGVSMTIRSYEELSDYARLGSGFAIPKAALALAGFLPAFAYAPEETLERQLARFGGGIELTLLSALPKGSGLGTSSILAATVLGVLGELCGLVWDESEVCRRSFVIEQMLTSGGGWQDQFGGALRGVKFLRTEPGSNQIPEVRYLPDHLFADPANSACLLLYYTGITRVANTILGEIVRGMFLNEGAVMRSLARIGREADDMAGALQKNSYPDFAKTLARTWASKKALDAGTNPAPVQAILDRVGDLTLGAALGGAGGGGYMLLAAKDPAAAVRIRRILEENPPNDRARFVEMTLASSGMRITRS